MAPTPATTEAFLEVLGEIAHGAGTSEDLTDRLRQVVLDYASETPDNRAAMARIADGKGGAAVGDRHQPRGRIEGYRIGQRQAREIQPVARRALVDDLGGARQ